MSYVKPSLWEATSSIRPFPSLQEKLNVEVAVIGGGITGLTLARSLAKKGLSVGVLERDHLLQGTTGQTSAHLSTYWDRGYTYVKEHHGLQAAHVISQAMQTAVDHIRDNSETLSGNSYFQYVNGYLFRENETQESLGMERYVCEELGLPIKDIPENILPFPILDGFCIERQGQFHPISYLKMLVEDLNEMEVPIFEHSPAVDYSEDQVETPYGTIRAESIVHATHVPVGFNIMQTMNVPYYSYVIAGPYSGQLPHGIFWDTAQPYHYIRTFQKEGKTYLLVGGEDQHTGSESDKDRQFSRLEEYAKNKFQLQKVLYKWSAQFFEPSDGLPFIGKSPGHKNNYIATGFSGDGLVLGTASGLMLADLIAEGMHPWEKVFSPYRLSALNSELIKNNLHVGKSFFSDRLPEKNMVEYLTPGEGYVHHSPTTPRAYYKTEEGELLIMSAVCSHMKCVVHWNPVQKSFDCPCHGSRFTCKGDVIEGPALKGLDKISPT